MIRYKNSKNKHMASVSWKYICIKHIKISDFYCEKSRIFQHVKSLILLVKKSSIFST